MATIFQRKPLMLRMARFLKPYKGYLALAAVGALAETAGDLLFPWPLKLLFDHLFSRHPLKSWLEPYVVALFGPPPQGILYFALAAILTIALLNACASLVQNLTMPRVGHWVMHDLRKDLYWHVQGLALAYHGERRLGDLMNTLTADIQSVREMIESSILGIVVNGATLIGMVFVMLAIDWRFAVLALSVTPFLSVFVYSFTLRIKQASRDVRRREGVVASVAQEVLSSIQVVQAFTREDYEQARFEREHKERISAGIRARTLQAQRKMTVEIFVAGGTVLVIWYGTLHVLNGTLLPGALLVFLAYLNRVYRPLRTISKQSDAVARAVVGFEHIERIMETEKAVADLPGARRAPAFQGVVCFESVSFAYRAGVPVLSGVTFSARAGERIAIVGSTGAGKTTLLSLIARFNDPLLGTVRIDGEDVRSYTLASLRRQISLVLQDTVLFYGTVRDNIAYGRPEASQSEIVAAARAANAHEFIECLAEGYDTLIGERGVTLSGGQRQRIAIARALIRETPIVLLDEPTTGLDADSEALVIEALSRLMAGRTTFVVAHRLATVRSADMILVLEQGEIVERGTHDHLLLQSGRYAELYNLQFNQKSATESARGPAWSH